MDERISVTTFCRILRRKLLLNTTQLNSKKSHHLTFARLPTLSSCSQEREKERDEIFILKRWFIETVTKNTLTVYTISWAAAARERTRKSDSDLRQQKNTNSQVGECQRRKSEGQKMYFGLNINFEWIDKSLNSFKNRQVETNKQTIVKNQHELQRKWKVRLKMIKG